MQKAIINKIIIENMHIIIPTNIFINFSNGLSSSSVKYYLNPYQNI